MFSDELEEIFWEETTKAIYSKTDADVRRALGRKEHLDINNFVALISPTITPYLEVMARLSQRYTTERFGKTISILIPLYLTNSCANSCVYCGLHISDPMKETILTEEEIVNEYRAVKRLVPSENLLLVTGENPATTGTPYIARTLDLAKPYFSNLQIGIMPPKVEKYQELTSHSLSEAICFQETYHRANYKAYHPRGTKSRFEWRVDNFDHVGQAGVHKIDMGVLIGLEEWRTDVMIIAYYLHCLQKHYRRTRYNVSFPRTHPSESGGFQPNVAMNGRKLAQLTFAIRVSNHDIDVSYSTREGTEIRNHMATLGVTTMSAEGKTEPGGYYSYPQALEQFHVSDERRAIEVERDSKKLGREPVWKN